MEQLHRAILNGPHCVNSQSHPIYIPLLYNNNRIYSRTELMNFFGIPRTMVFRKPCARPYMYSVTYMYVQSSSPQCPRARTHHRFSSAFSPHHRRRTAAVWRQRESAQRGCLLLQPPLWVVFFFFFRGAISRAPLFSRARLIRRGKGIGVIRKYMYFRSSRYT